MSSSLTIVRAIIVRLLFTCHGLVAVWRLYYVTKDPRFWYFATALGLLLIETTVTLVKRGGKEWKWFCPSVFIYLTSTVPSIWFLELYEMEKRITVRETTNSTKPLRNESLEDLHASLGKVLGVRFEIRIPILLSPDEWIRTLEQLLLLILILGRWLLPKGKLTHDQLSQLLLVYIGTAADIVEFFEAFKEDKVRYNKLLCIIILGLWSLSLLQFTLVLTAARARRDQSGLVTRQQEDKDKEMIGCCSADVYGILISIVLQDLPFLVLRLLLIFKFHVLSYTNMFFTSKNTLVILLLLYRLIVVYIERRAERKDEPFSHLDPPISSVRNRWSAPNLSVVCNGNTRVGEKAKLMKKSPMSSDHYHTEPRIYRLRQEKSEWGNNYHFEQMNSQV